MRGLLGCFVVSGGLGCLPVSDFDYGSGTTGSAGSGEGMSATSNVGVTGTGEVTSGSTGTSSSGGGESMSSAAEPTCGALICKEVDMQLDGCDIFTQECPEGLKCVPVITDGAGTWNATRCVPVSGTDAPGEACVAESVADGLDSCVEGAICWGVDMAGNGSCVEQCSGTAEAPFCSNKGFCTISGSGVLNLCLPSCDPLLQDCAEGDACYSIGDGFTCAPDASGDTGKANDPCEFINVCERGLFCADPVVVGAGCPMGSMGCCTPFCEFPEGACANPDQACVQFFDPAMLPPGDPWLDIGYCGVGQ